MSAAVVVMMMVLAPRPASASGGGVLLFENFHQIVYRQPGDNLNYPLYAINDVDPVGGAFVGQVFGPNGDASSVKRAVSGNRDYAKLTVKNDATPGNYTNAELASVPTGFSYSQGGVSPTPGHPIWYSVVARYSDDYESDGSGGAVGTAGTWMWDSPFDFTDPYNPIFYPTNSFGFIWIEAGGLPQGGLQAMVLNQTIPVYDNPVNTQMDVWKVYTVKWSVNSSGQQRIQFWVNLTPVGDVTLDQPLPPLSVELWNDNQYPTFLEDGSFIVEYHNQPGQQSLSIDKVLVYGPDGESSLPTVISQLDN